LKNRRKQPIIMGEKEKTWWVVGKGLKNIEKEGGKLKSCAGTWSPFPGKDSSDIVSVLRRRKRGRPRDLGIRMERKEGFIRPGPRGPKQPSLF